jgi:hypothetical protein
METRLPAHKMDEVHRCLQRKHVDEQFYGLAETLLWRNEHVAELLDSFRGPADGPNESQLTFAAVAMLDLEVPNGGLLQFFWNRPGWVDRVASSLQNIGSTELADSFEQSTAEMTAQMGTFSEFRNRDSLEAFSECAQKFHFDEFDSEYIDQEPQLHAKAVAFVSQRLGDFAI